MNSPKVMNTINTQLRDSNGRFTSAGNMIHELDMDAISHEDEHQSFFTHLKRLDDLFRDEVLMRIVTDQRTFIWETAGKGYLAAACNQYIYAEKFPEDSQARSDIIFNAQHVRNFGLAYFGYSDDKEAVGRFDKNIDKLLKKHAEVHENACADELLEIWHDCGDEETTIEDAQDFIDHQKTYMSEDLHPRLAGLLDGARFDHLQERATSEWDEDSAKKAVRTAVHYVLSFFDHDEWGVIANTRSRLVEAVMKGWKKEYKDAKRNDLWIAREDLRMTQKFIDDHDLSYDS